MVMKKARGTVLLSPRLAVSRRLDDFTAMFLRNHFTVRHAGAGFPVDVMVTASAATGVSQLAVLFLEGATLDPANAAARWAAFPSPSPLASAAPPSTVMSYD